MTNIYENIDKLIEYGMLTGLIGDADKIYVRNRLLTKLKLDSYEETGAVCNSADELDEILGEITDYAFESGLIENNSIVYRDIFDTEIMDTLTPYPYVDTDKFNALFKETSENATDYIIFGIEC